MKFRGHSVNCYWHSCRRADGLAGHAVVVGLPVVGQADLYRVARSSSADCTQAVQ